VSPKLAVEPDRRQLLDRIAAELLPGDAPTAWTWLPSDECDAFATDEWVVKIERDDDSWVVRREVPAFPVLQSMGFDEFPEVVASHESTGWDEVAPFMVMPRYVRRPFDDLWREDAAIAHWTVGRIGDFLRRLGQVDWRTVPGVVRPTERVASFPSWLEDLLAPMLPWSSPSPASSTSRPAPGSVTSCSTSCARRATGRSSSTPPSWPSSTRPASASW
jgi:hypothetical protein